jgi:hypothetical protein
MSLRLAAGILVLAALAASPAAAGDGPMPTVQQLGSGVLTADGGTRFVAIPASLSTLLEQVEVRGGAVRRTTELPGSWGIPAIAYGVAGEGLSADGRTLVLGDLAQEYPRRTSGFLVLSARTLHVLRTIELKGDFAYDAVSPNARSLYLIQHVDPTNTQRYVVRRYDLGEGRLVPGRIADRTQKGWVMAGYPQARATSAGGRWVYTLYANPGGYPFVHALDTVRGVAHCVGLPWTGDQSGFYNMRLSLRNADRTLAVHWLSGRPWLAVDTGTWHVGPDRRAGFPWLALGAGVAAAFAGVAAFLLRVRRRRAHELEEELEQLLREPGREAVI